MSAASNGHGPDHRELRPKRSPPPARSLRAWQARQRRLLVPRERAQHVERDGRCVLLTIFQSPDHYVDCLCEQLAVYEVRADASTRSFRLLFAAEGRYSQVLLSLSVFEKRTQKTPARELELAETRLRDWRERGAAKKERGAASASSRKK